MPQLIVQQEGTPHPLWPEQGHENAYVDIHDAPVWERVCTLLKDALYSRTALPFNVFLLFAKEEVLGGRDRPALENVVERARLRGWGARILAVLRDLPRLIDIDEATIPDLDKWMRTLLSGRVSDLIQISEGAGEPDPQKRNETLRDRATAVEKRLSFLDADPVGRGWRCVLPPDLAETAERLGPKLAITSPDEDTTSDLLVALNTSDPDEQEGLIEGYLLKDAKGAPDRVRRVITYMREPKGRLDRYCKARGLDQPISVAGDFELWYLLLRLNERAHPASESVRSILLAEAPIMRASLPSVLLTCAFGLHEEGQWLAAAEEVGELLRLAPHDLRFRVELAIDPGRLGDVVRSMHQNMEDVAAWIHIGHGLGRSGLWVPEVGPVLPELWSPSFGNRQLRLALFATCDSHEIARHFAEQGANVAIGFEGEVQSAKARHFTVEVLRAMIADGMRGDSILSGFQEGESRFKALRNLNAKPRAYYPRRG
jgi:hypothetical protein